MLQWLLAMSVAGKPRPKTVIRPRLEWLEDRLTPSTFAVNTFADETTPGGTLSLREAILKSNARPGPDTITLQAGTYNLTQGKVLTINTNSLNIVGQGAGRTTVNALGLSGVFEIGGSGLTVQFANLTITGGRSGGGGGIGMMERNNLIFRGANVSGNTATSSGGGGIYQRGGNFTFINSVLSNNVAHENGGGYINAPASAAPAKITIKGSTVRNNNCDAEGGGIASFAAGSFTVTNSTINGNSTRNSTNGSGGGIFTTANTFAITGSNVNNNQAQGAGGGIYTTAATFTLTGSNVNNNRAAGAGGAIWYSHASSMLTITSSHVNGNTTAQAGGGILLAENGAILVLNSSTVNGNGALDGPGGGVLGGPTNSLVTLNHSQVNDNRGALGGGICNATVRIRKGSQVNGNVAYGGAGGGIYSADLNVEVTGSQVLNNVAQGYGGGINAGTGGATILQSRVSGNVAAAGSGGGIFSGNLLMSRSTVANNTATADGGGVAAYGNIAVLESTFSGNRAGASGGALAIGTAGPAATTILPMPNGSILANVTISGNYASQNGAGVFFGGSGGLAIIDDTIVSNIAGSGGSGMPGGGLVIMSGTVEVGNTIIASNVSNVSGSSRSSDIFQNFIAGLIDRGGNLIGSNDASAFMAGKPNAFGSYVGTSAARINPKLGPLANNGGPTQTQALLSGSLAIKHGLVSLNRSFGITTDQRGVLRSTTKPDIGAFDPPPSPPPPRRASSVREPASSYRSEKTSERPSFFRIVDDFFRTLSPWGKSL